MTQAQQMLKPGHRLLPYLDHLKAERKHKQVTSTLPFPLKPVIEQEIGYTLLFTDNSTLTEPTRIYFTAKSRIEAFEVLINSAQKELDDPRAQTTHMYLSEGPTAIATLRIRGGGSKWTIS